MLISNELARDFPFDSFRRWDKFCILVGVTLTLLVPLAAVNGCGRVRERFRNKGHIVPPETQVALEADPRIN
jgi:hypothetical protein